MQKLFIYTVLSSALLGCSFVKEPRTETDSIIDARPTIDNETPKAQKPKSIVSYTVKKGDTLGKIAKQHLGKASQYRLLAAFNNIDVNAPIQIGQKLRIPTDADTHISLLKKRKPTAAKKQTTNIPAETTRVVEPPQIVAQAYDPKELTSLYIRGEYLTYLEKLYTKPGTETSEEAIRVVEKQSTRFLNANNYTAAEQLYTQALNKLPLSTEKAQRLNQGLSRVVVDKSLIDAQTHLKKGHHALSYEALKNAYNRDASYCNNNQQFISPRNEVTEQFHQVALRFYRAQELDNALIYWNKILHISPNDDLATVYKNRVTTLQKKLKEL